MNAIAFEHVTKRFASVLAVDRFSEEVRSGSVHAFLGPNGAGKTSLLRMLLGLMMPDTGRIAIAPDLRSPQGGLDPLLTGYLPEERGLYIDQTIRRGLVYFAGLRGLFGRQARVETEQWLERLELRERANEPVKRLSKGNQQKVQLVAALLHRPKLVILDEPFTGLDPINQQLVSMIIREVVDGGATVLLSAHQMDLVEKLSDRITLMAQGRNIASGTLAELRQRVPAGQRVRIHVTSSISATELAGIAGVQRVEAPAEVQKPGDTEWICHLETQVGWLDVVSQISQRIEVSQVQCMQSSLYEIYISLLGRSES